MFGMCACLFGSWLVNQPDVGCDVRGWTTPFLSKPLNASITELRDYRNLLRIPCASD